MEPDAPLQSQLPLQQQLGIPDEIFDEAEQGKADRKSRAAKKRDKIEKRRKKFEDPEFKKQERLKKRRRAREKLKRETVGMNSDQVAEFVVAKKLAKEKVKEKMIAAMTTGLPILIDLVYEEHMNSKQRTSLAVQIELIYKSMRKLSNPCSLHLCSMSGTIQEQLTGMRYHFWPMTSHKEDVDDVAKKLGKQPIYLSPDGQEQLKEVTMDHAYIIGGLVDRTVLKNASLKRSQQLGIKSYRLPIEGMMQNRKCLNLDHVSLLLVKYMEIKDWAKAFEFAAPKRFRREGEQGADESEEQDQKKQQDSSSDSDSSDLGGDQPTGETTEPKQIDKPPAAASQDPTS